MEERYATEEQQIEAIKNFWKENGMAIVVGAVLGLGGLFGWRYYNEQQIEAQEAASTAYETTLNALQGEGGFTKGAEFVKANEGESYANLTALQLASDAIVSKDYAEAEKQLTNVVAHAEVAAVKNLALLRLARVQVELGKHDEALASINKMDVDQYRARALEISGDIQQKLGNTDAARAAYTEALELDGVSSLVQVKLDNLAVAGENQ